MSFRQKIKHYLIHGLNYTNKAADELISSGKITVNGKGIFRNEKLFEEDELAEDGFVIKTRKKYEYFALHKPQGIESTFDKKRPDNLSTVFPFNDQFFVAGRLDKASEGLLLISNNGKWVNDITSAANMKEKEYEVEVDCAIDTDFIESISAGIDIGICHTRPCKARCTGKNTFEIILTEGKNRQIRRMCKTMGFNVIRLKRVRIDKFYLSDIKRLGYRKIHLT